LSIISAILGKEIQISLTKVLSTIFFLTKFDLSLFQKFSLSSIWPFIHNNSHKAECTNPPLQEELSTIPMPKINYVCMLGGTDLGKDDEFRTAAYNLDVALATRKLHLVYEGGV